MLDKILRFALKFRLPILAVILGLTLVSAIYFFKSLDRADNSLPVWFSRDDAGYETYERFLSVFGNDRFVLAAFETPEVFSPEALYFIRDISNSFESLPEVTQVLSLTHLKTVEGEGGEVAVKPVLESIPEDAASLTAIKSFILANPDLSGKLVSRDSKVANLIIEVATPHEAGGSSRIKSQILNIIREKNTRNYPYHLTGSPITDEAFNRLIIRDQLIFFPATVALCILLLAFFFRNFWVVLIPTAIQAALLFWILAAYFLLGHKLNVVAGLVCPILVTVCIINSVHLMLAYFDGRWSGLSANAGLKAAVNNLAKPCLFVTLTTLAGFLSFNPSGIPPIRLLGNLTALGVTLALFLTLFFLPAVLSYIPTPGKRISVRFHSPRVQAFLNSAASLGWKHPIRVGAVFLALTALSLVGLSRLKIETNFFEYFFKSEPVRQDLEFFDRNMMGAGAYEIWLTPENGADKIALNPQALQEADRFKTWALRDPVTRSAITPVDFVKKINRALHGGDSRFDSVPETPKEISEALLMGFSSEDLRLERFQSPDHLNMRLSFRCLNLSSERMRAYLDKIHGEAQKRFGPLGIEVRLTGYGPLWVRLQGELLKSQIKSLAISLVAVSLLMMIFLKSFKAGLISMVPNALPILFAFGAMGFAGVRLDVATVMVAALSLGVTVDDTIHYITRFREFRKTDDDYRALVKTNQSVGTAILFSGAVLVGGFSVLCLGSFKPTVYFGLMTAVTLLISVFCEIFLLPALLIYLKPFSRRPGRRGV